MEKRLSKDDWLTHGLVKLSKKGSKSLKAGPMAQELNVSRGSFYWHFASAADFELQLMNAWKHRNTEAIIIELNDNVSPKSRLTDLVKLTLANDLNIDKAMRAWSIEDSRASKIVAEVDKKRIDYVKSLLDAITNLDKPELALRSKLLYWACIGKSIVETKSGSDFDLKDVQRLIKIFVN